MLERTLYPGKLWPTLRFAALATLLVLVLASGVELSGGRYGRVPLFVLSLLVLFFAVQLLPGAVYLKLTRKGFEYKNVLPARFIKWSDVDHFTTYRYHYTHYAGWVYRHTTSVSVLSPPFWPWRMLPLSVKRFLNIGIEDGFTVNFELKNADALVSFLEQWRREHDDATWVNIGNSPE